MGDADSDNSRNEESPRRMGGAAINFGLNFAVGMAALTVIGYKLDQRRGGGQAFTLAGALLGLVYGGYELWKLVRTPPGDGKTP